MNTFIESRTGQKFRSEFGPGGLRTLTPVLEPFQRPTEFDRLHDAHKQLRRDVQATRLLLDIRRILPHSFDPVEKKSLLQAEVLLTKNPKSLSDRFLKDMTTAVEKRLGKLPAERRALELRTTTRAASGSRVVRFTASTPTIDRHNSIIKPEGIRTENFARNPIFAWMHDVYGGGFFGGTPSIDSIIGKVTKWESSPSAFVIDAEFARHDRAEQAFQLVKDNFLNAVSIGFRPLKWHEESVDGRDVTVFDEVDLLECSLVGVPSNMDALAHRNGRPAAIA